MLVIYCISVYNNLFRSFHDGDTNSSGQTAHETNLKNGFVPVLVAVAANRFLSAIRNTAKAGSNRLQSLLPVPRQQKDADVENQNDLAINHILLEYEKAKPKSKKKKGEAKDTPKSSKITQNLMLKAEQNTKQNKKAFTNDGKIASSSKSVCDNQPNLPQNDNSSSFSSLSGSGCDSSHSFTDRFHSHLPAAYGPEPETVDSSTVQLSSNQPHFHFSEDVSIETTVTEPFLETARLGSDSEWSTNSKIENDQTQTSDARQIMMEMQETRSSLDVPKKTRNTKKQKENISVNSKVGPFLSFVYFFCLWWRT